MWTANEQQQQSNNKKRKKKNRRRKIHTEHNPEFKDIGGKKKQRM